MLKQSDNVLGKDLRIQYFAKEGSLVKARLSETEEIIIHKDEQDGNGNGWIENEKLMGIAVLFQETT